MGVVFVIVGCRGEHFGGNSGYAGTILEVILASWSTLKHQGSPHGSQDASWERLGCFLAPSPRESLTPCGHFC